MSKMSDKHFAGGIRPASWRRAWTLALGLCAVLGPGGCSDDTPGGQADTRPTDAAPGDGTGSREPRDGTRKEGGRDTSPDGPKQPAMWLSGPSMSTPRVWHTATTLKSGNVLAVGGATTGIYYDATATAELYNLSSGKWVPAGSMSKARFAHSATLLQDGRVLVFGGCGPSQFNYCMDGTIPEIYNPSTPSSPWKKAADAPRYRRSHCAALLQDGKVLIAGGFDQISYHTAIDIYDPKSDSWFTPIAALSTTRNLLSCTTLSSGKVLIAGGYDGVSKFLGSFELYDPQAGTIKLLTATLKEPRDSHEAVLLGDGKVLIVGGYGATAVKSAEIFDPSTNTVLAGGSPGTSKYQHTATRLADGTVLVVGGLYYHSEVYQFLPSLLGWKKVVSLKYGRYLHAAALVGTKLFVTGGMTDVPADGGTPSADAGTNEVAGNLVEIFVP